MQKKTSDRGKHCEGEAKARQKWAKVTIEPGRGKGRVLAKRKLQEKEGGSKESN